MRDILRSSVAIAALTGLCWPLSPYSAGKKPPAETPEVTETKNLNAPEQKEVLVALPREWNPYRRNLEELVGTYVVLVPSAASSNGFTVQVLDRAITDAGIASIKLQASEGAEPIYRSRVEGKLAANLSFVAGNLNTQADSLYELTLADNATALIAPDSKYVDSQKAQRVLSRIPPQFKDVFFVTSVTHRILAYKEYQKYQGAVEAAFTVVKAGGNYYYGNEFSSVTHTIYFSGLVDSASFGEFDQTAGVYKKRSTPLVATAKPLVRPRISLEAADLLRSTIKMNGVRKIE